MGNAIQYSLIGKQPMHIRNIAVREGNMTQVGGIMSNKLLIQLSKNSSGILYNPGNSGAK
jgi:hypothetical protein